MANNISILPHNDCCGCRACGDVCPAKCISFKIDQEGFFYPHVDDKVCIKCGKCVKNCPEINPNYNPSPDYVIAAYATSSEQRNEGSSGGVFGVLATNIIRRGGKVWGAAFDDNLKLRHISAQSIEGLKPLMRSKYLQSDTSSCFKHIQGDLKNGTTTLFCGTPCQCNALFNIVGNNPNLYLIDLICHGVPSQDLFDRCILWVEKNKKLKIRNFAFRSKYRGSLHPQAFTYEAQKDNKTVIVNGLHHQFPHYFGFQKYITLRPSCYTCKWARSERRGDITLGDFWGVEKIDPSLDPKLGLSEILCNTDKGRQLLQEAKEDKQIWTKDFPFSQIVGKNGCLHSPTILKPERAEFFRDLRTLPFDQVVALHLVSKRQWIFDLYYGLPNFLRKIVRRIMDKRMKYE